MYVHALLSVVLLFQVLTPIYARENPALKTQSRLKRLLVKRNKIGNRYEPHGSMKSGYVNFHTPSRSSDLQDESCVQDGKLSGAGSFVRPLERSRRENSGKGVHVLPIMSEISSVEVLPIIRKSRTIECRRDPDGVVDCHQDDLRYKIRLKHPDLPQDMLETLIANLYGRLFKATNDKKKRDGGNSEPSVVRSPEETPFIIVLPPDQSDPPKVGLQTKIESHPKITKNKDSTEADLSDDLVIECSPTDDEPLKGDDVFLSKNDDFKSTGSLVYSCKWIGKRAAQTRRVIVEKKRHGPPLQSFQVLIDPSKVDLNLLPVTVFH